MNWFNIPNDKMFVIVLIGLLVIGIIVYCNTMYVKSCVKTELEEIKKQNKKKRKIKKTEEQLQQQQLLQLEQLQQLQQMQQVQDVQNFKPNHNPSPNGDVGQLSEIDADSYYDPLSQ